MKKKLLLLLGSFSNPQKNAACSTLAWMAKESGWLFDVYYDAYRIGDHFGGGPISRAEKGRVFGSTITGHSHVEAWHYLLTAYRVHVALLDTSYFEPWIRDMKIPVSASGVDPLPLFLRTAEVLGLQLPEKLLILGGSEGEDAYLYPFVSEQKVMAVHKSAPLSAESMKRLRIREVETLLCTQREINQLKARGIEISKSNKDFPPMRLPYLSHVLSEKYSNWCSGYFLGDPVVTAFFIPFLFQTKRLALYSEPLEQLINERTLRKLKDDPLVYGRMYNDKDALAVSRLGGCWQLVDPGRPPFPAVSKPIAWREAPYDLFAYIESYASDKKLREHAENGDILTSLVFWSGCVREMENFYRLFELISSTGFKCGTAVTTDTFARGMHSPFGLLAHPLQSGGVFPLVEPLLASSGLGFSLESCLPEGVFKSHIEEALKKLEQIIPPGLKPWGWWACLDTELEKDPAPQSRLRGRPFGRYRAGNPVSELYKVLAGYSFRYGVSKVRSEEPIPYEGGLIYALPQTAGAWQGWSPFHDVGAIEDLKHAEKKLYLRNTPGYLLGTIDTCLWTFSHPLWERGGELKAMIEFIMHGGRTGKLVNVHPYALFRYARFLEENGYARDTSAVEKVSATLQWYAMRVWQGMRKISFR
jgi:hypothetical protein